jgi:SAM-dependent methyltransferase
MRFRYLGCAQCGSEYLDPRPSAAMLPGFYPPDYHAYNEDHGTVAGALVSMRARVRGRQYRGLCGGSAGRLFDVGTGDCRHFEDLRRYGDFECSGVEINPDMAARARELGYDVATGTLEEFDCAGRAGAFDLVSMNHVLEHVVEPAVVLRKAWELLRPGGSILGQLPRSDSWEHVLFGREWAGYHYPRHLQAFTQDALADALRRAGFKRVRVASAPHLQSAISVQNLLVSRGYRGRLRHGKCRFYSLLLLGVVPFEFVALAARRSGIMNFQAVKPAV